MHAFGTPGGFGPTHDVTQRRNASWNPVHVHSEMVQQLQRWENAGARGDVRGYAIRWVRARFQQDLRERQVPHSDKSAPEGSSRKLGMPVPVVFGIGIRALPEQLTRDFDQPSRPIGRFAMEAGMAHVKERLPVLR